ncbi:MULTISPECIES: ABC-2 family transporter protein [unclassified Fusibacter]|uniref:ABC transporter permease n=1 Tax=unclassified Fusibacter TaxID=2624464 RepID=UPI0010117490|nr:MULTISPECIES: ABC-2 family transporter protein [unclassified Fusibacter]MCK8058522.1 ABC-2 family transporter protein [Fusibacter sp. A2]NPE22709.1 hypothetical protein [Fusibacter sp. A1]RXV60269.1 hypothetical protein DWB64_12730 [Fusibacter sp. A1]
MRKIDKYFEVMKITLSNKLVYFWDYLSNNLFFVFIMFVYWMLWKAIFASKGDVVGGFTLNSIMWYLVVTELVTLSRPNVHMQITKDVKDGSIAYLLNKPYDYILYNFSLFLGETGIKLMTNGLVGLLVGLVFVGPLNGANLLYLPFVLVSIVLGCMLNFFIYMTLALTAFWFEENQAFFWIYSKLVFTMGGMLIPIDLFPEWLQKIAVYMPFAYVTYVPARLAVHFDMGLFISNVSVQLCYVVTFYLLANVLYRKGARQLNVQGG